MSGKSQGPRRTAIIVLVLLNVALAFATISFARSYYIAARQVQYLTLVHMLAYEGLSVGASDEDHKKLLRETVNVGIDQSMASIVPESCRLATLDKLREIQSRYPPGILEPENAGKMEKWGKELDPNLIRNISVPAFERIPFLDQSGHDSEL